jgi:hypothetical protein
MSDAESVVSEHFRKNPKASDIIRLLCIAPECAPPAEGAVAQPRVCAYCALRLVNLQKPKPYLLPLSDLHTTLERCLSVPAGALASGGDPALPCAVCFNISERTLWERTGEENKASCSSSSSSTNTATDTGTTTTVKADGDASSSASSAAAFQQVPLERPLCEVLAALCAPYGVSSETYTLCITIPHLVVLREFACCNFLAKRGSLSAPSDPSLPDVVELKQVLRWRLGEWVESNLEGTRSHQDGSFQIQIAFSLDSGVEEMIQVLLKDDQLQVRNNGGRRGRKRKKPYSNSTDAGATDEKPDPKLGDKINGSMIGRAIHRFIKTPDAGPKFAWPPGSTTKGVGATYDASVKRAAIFLLGRYNKFLRGVSQSPWLVDNDRIGATSVEEVVGNPIQKLFGCSEYKFHSAGREDIDVRMLGKGRPFMLELLNAKRFNVTEQEIDDAESELNKRQDMVKITCLHLSNKAMMTTLQAYSENKRKTYACVVWTSRRLGPEDMEKVNALKDLEIQQMTPARVLHRRTLLTRSRMIHAAKCVQLNPHYFIVYLDTSAGTYVKEFIHGDFGRTTPNFGSLTNCTADILQLDVTELEGVDNMCDSKKWK